MTRQEIDSPYAWFRLALSVAMSTIGGVGLWSVVVALPAVQAEFGADRAAASLPYTLATVGIGVGSVLMGRLVDRAGIVLPVLIGAFTLGFGYILASFAGTLTQFALVYLVIGTFGAAATFVPLISDISFWFDRRRGIAVALVASGNYLAGAIWPTVIEWSIRAHGWRFTHLGIGVACLVTLPAMALLLRSRPPVRALGSVPVVRADRRIDLPPRVLQGLLAFAALACCVAMAMPQVHIVAYCGDLGYGAQAGAVMLSLMLGFGVVSRIGSGLLADRVGGLLTLLIGSAAQMAALVLYMLMDGLAALYVVSALFGLFQGGLVPSYAIIVRENFPANEAGGRIGTILMMTLLGMALGGWMSGAIFDRTGSYAAAFGNGVLWNVLNLAVALLFLSRVSGRPMATARPAASAAG
jgi:MFS family permease